jgi:hypothetical protein
MEERRAGGILSTAWPVVIKLDGMASQTPSDNPVRKPMHKVMYCRHILERLRVPKIGIRSWAIIFGCRRHAVGATGDPHYPPERARAFSMAA